MGSLPKQLEEVFIDDCITNGTVVYCLPCDPKEVLRC